LKKNLQVTQEYLDAIKAGLDAESEYRLALDKKKEATLGAQIAKDEYDKYSQAHKQAKKSLDALLTSNISQKSALLI